MSDSRERTGGRIPLSTVFDRKSRTATTPIQTRNLNPIDLPTVQHFQTNLHSPISRHSNYSTITDEQSMLQEHGTIILTPPITPAHHSATTKLITPQTVRLEPLSNMFEDQSTLTSSPTTFITPRDTFDPSPIAISPIIASRNTSSTNPNNHITTDELTLLETDPNETKQLNFHWNGSLTLWEKGILFLTICLMIYIHMMLDWQKVFLLSTWQVGWRDFQYSSKILDEDTYLTYFQTLQQSCVTYLSSLDPSRVLVMFLGGSIMSIALDTDPLTTDTYLTNLYSTISSVCHTTYTTILQSLSFLHTVYERLLQVLQHSYHPIQSLLHRLSTLPRILLYLIGLVTGYPLIVYILPRVYMTLYTTLHTTLYTTLVPITLHMTYTLRNYLIPVIVFYLVYHMIRWYILTRAIRRTVIQDITLLAKTILIHKKEHYPIAYLEEDVETFVAMNMQIQQQVEDAQKKRVSTKQQMKKKNKRGPQHMLLLPHHQQQQEEHQQKQETSYTKRVLGWVWKRLWWRSTKEAVVVQAEADDEEEEEEEEDTTVAEMNIPPEELIHSPFPASLPYQPRNVLQKVRVSMHGYGVDTLWQEVVKALKADKTRIQTVTVEYEGKQQPCLKYLSSKENRSWLFFWRK